MRSTITLSLTLFSLVNARPRVVERQEVVYVTNQATVTTDQIIATNWDTVHFTAPAPSASPFPVQQVQVIVNQIAAQYTYSTARTVFAVPTVLTLTETETVMISPYSTNGQIVQPAATTTLTNTLDAQATPIGTNIGEPVTATLPQVSALISGATVTIPAQTITYYTPVVDAIGHTIVPETTVSAAQPTVSIVSVSAMTAGNSDLTTQSVENSFPIAASQAASLSSNTAMTATTVLSTTNTNIVSSGTSSSSSSVTSSVGSSVSTSSESSSSTATQTAVQSSISDYNQDSFVSVVLDKMNGYRAQHNAQALTWDSGLAATALQYAQSCNFEPSVDPSFGETMAAGTTADPTFYIDLWYNEGSSYNYGQPGFSDATGHYTQLVWGATTTVGCGFSSGCGQYTNYLVCRYSSPGNVVGGTNNDQYFISNVVD